MADVTQVLEPVARPADDLAAPPAPGPGRPPRTLGSDLRRLGGDPARRARLLVTVAVLALAVAAPLVARSGTAAARSAARDQGAERAAAAAARAQVTSDERTATAAAEVAAEQAAAARAARNEQRRQLAALGLNEQTIDAFLVEVNANAELVEYRREVTSRDVNRQAAEIPQMQECVWVAGRALNGAWNAATFGEVPPPEPSELCRALLAAGT